MGKKKNRQIQQSAQMRGYRAAMKEVHPEITDIADAVYNIRLMIETSRIMTVDHVSEKLEGIQERLTELAERTEYQSNRGRSTSILDLQNRINIHSDGEPEVIIDDETIDFFIKQEFQD